MLPVPLPSPLPTAPPSPPPTPSPIPSPFLVPAPRLGLGARFVSHSQAMGVGGTGGAGRRGGGGGGGGGGWRDGVAQSAARTAAAVEERLGARLAGRGKWGGRGRRDEEEKGGGVGDGDGSGEDGEEESRAGRFGRRGSSTMRNVHSVGGKKRKGKE
ncbi:unnamed protein product [Closterium sp. NIES-54]